MRRLLLLAAVAALIPFATGSWADNPQAPGAKSASTDSKPIDIEAEARAMALVREHLPELGEILGPLKACNPPEYRKAIQEIAAEARTLAEVQVKNPARHNLALNSWKARTRVELIAAQLAGSPTPERTSQLRTAIEARVETDIQRQRFEFEQAEASLVRVRENLDRAEKNRDRARAALDRAEKNRESKVDARFRALQPKSKTVDSSKPQPKTPAKSTATSVPAPINVERK